MILAAYVNIEIQRLRINEMFPVINFALDKEV